MAATQFTFRAIGVVHSGLVDKLSTPRQPFVAGEGAVGTIELSPGEHFEDALADLEAFSHIWVLFIFDKNPTWHPKVMPPHGSDVRRGVFATRSPHRPNPIGMSVLRLHEVRGLTLVVSGLDILDGTPVVDIKPYVPMADVVADANRGWLGADARAAESTGTTTATADALYEVRFVANVNARLEWWYARTQEVLRERITRALAVAPTPHAFRRIRPQPDGDFILALPSWRVRFRKSDRVVEVTALTTAHKPAHFAHDPTLAPHREFVERFG